MGVRLRGRVLPPLLYLLPERTRLAGAAGCRFRWLLPWATCAIAAWHRPAVLLLLLLLQLPSRLAVPADVNPDGAAPLLHCQARGRRSGDAPGCFLTQTALRTPMLAP
jgi:hypothetical protein